MEYWKVEKWPNIKGGLKILGKTPKNKIKVSANNLTGI